MQGMMTILRRGDEVAIGHAGRMSEEQQELARDAAKGCGCANCGPPLTVVFHECESFGHLARLAERLLRDGWTDYTDGFMQKVEVSKLDRALRSLLQGMAAEGMLPGFDN